MRLEDLTDLGAGLSRRSSLQLLEPRQHGLHGRFESPRLCLGVGNGANVNLRSVGSVHDHGADGDAPRGTDSVEP